MDLDDISRLLERVTSQLDSIEQELNRVSTDVAQVQDQGIELGEQIESVKRAVKEIDPIL